jgi:uncharacterized cupin superfamily protein
LDDRFTVPADGLEEIIDRIGPGKGSFNVHAQSSNDEVTISLPPETEEDEYGLVLVINSTGIQAFSSQ